jgi:hypothetical protein
MSDLADTLAEVIHTLSELEIAAMLTQSDNLKKIRDIIMKPEI